MTKQSLSKGNEELKNGATQNTLLILMPTLAYLLIGIEIIIMISPFALYFYSVYGPVLKFFSANPYLSWTTEFFLPHMVFLDDPLILKISYLQVLLVIGMVLFMFAAVPLYYGRFTGKGVVQKSFYAKIRHPQYLFLAISGFGLLLYWPRFIILIMYISMLFVYYLLAKNEEWRMKGEVPELYEKYMTNTSMFIPGEPGTLIYNLFFGWIKPKWVGILTVYIVSLAVSVWLAFGVRNYTVKHLPIVSKGSISLLSVFPRPLKEVNAIYKVIENSAEIQANLADEYKPNLIYIFPGDFFLTAIVTDQDRRWFPDDDISQRIPEIFEWHQHKFTGGLSDFFKIFHNFFKTLGKVDTDYYVERLVFVEVRDNSGKLEAQQNLFKVGRQRTPVLIVDLDINDHSVISVHKASGANKWGFLPMPTF